jgi:hypothetical protein
MKLFISWSGERSKSFAFALKEWFPLVLHYVEPWLSEADIEAGQRWADAVAKELDACNFGILCVTKENLNSPWVLFEAGALAKSLEGSRVIPLLLDLDFREVSGPLAQFQAKKLEKIGLFETVQSINQSSAAPVPEERYKQLFEALWPELEKKISGIPKSATPSKQTRTQAEVLEELVGAVRNMESRLRDPPEESRLPRKRRMHPFMLRDIGKMIGDKRGDPITIMMMASIFRDDLPWLYEIGMEAYRQAAGGNKVKARESLDKFMRAIDITQHGPFYHELGLGPKIHRGMLKEMEFMLQEDLLERKQRPEIKKNPTDVSE